jgi:sugar lactone lactonase YvrE
LVWVDLSSSLVFEWRPDTGQSSILQRELMVTGVALGRSGALLFAGAAGLHVWQAADDWRTVLSEFEGQPLFLNDILADRRGRIYAGTYYWEGTPPTSRWRPCCRSSRRTTSPSSSTATPSWV